MDMWERLQECIERGPRFADERRYMTIICEIRYNEVAMHLFRPTPRIRAPSTNSLRQCYQSAEKTIRLWKELYEADRMSYSWVTIHSVCLSALTILYCIWMSSEISATVKIDAFTTIMRDASILLSATGEYWIEARRSRNRLDGLVNATVRWLIDRLTSYQRTDAQRRISEAQPQPQDGLQATSSTFDANQNGSPGAVANQAAAGSGYGYGNEGIFDTYISNQDLAAFVGAPDPFASDNTFLFDGMFSEYQPLFDFNGADMSVNFMA